MQRNEKSTATPEIDQRHVLLISPLTFSYHIAISESLRSMGYDVTWWDERASSAIWYKLALRFFPSVTVKFSERIFRERLKQLNANTVSHILVIKGEGLSQRFIRELREKFPSASLGLYLWDGIANVKNIFKIVNAFDSVATFDPVDAKNFKWTYRPLFGRNISSGCKNTAAKQYDWSFVGTIHSDRHRVIHRLRQKYGEQMKCFVFCYFQSPLILFLRRIFDQTLWVAPRGTLSTQSMTSAEVMEIANASKAVLDVEHPQQRGYTMRTIETLLAEKKLVTTNKYIIDCNIYHPSRVQVIDRENPEIDFNFLREPFLPISDDFRKYYSCEGWANELLSMQDAAKNTQ